MVRQVRADSGEVVGHLESGNLEYKKVEKITLRL
jgi:hypothetical protein